MKSILDPSFRYTASYDTDLRRTFARIRRDRAKSAARVVRDHAGTLVLLASVPTRTSLKSI
jgi:hypothetical protein